eukprot:754155_1
MVNTLCSIMMRWGLRSHSSSFRQNLKLPAVKSGALLFDSSGKDKTDKQHEQGMQLAGLPMCDSKVMNKGDGEMVVDGSSSTPDFMSVEAVAGNEVLNHQDSTSTLETSSSSSSESGSFESSDDGDDFLDLLVDSLDGEFDPELLI